MSNIFRIIRIAKPLYKIIIIIALLIVASALLDLTAPFFSRMIVDTIVAKLNTQSNPPFQTILFFAAMIFIIDTFSALFTSISNRLGDYFAGELRKFLTSKFYEKVLGLPQKYFDTELSGKIVNQLNRGIVTIGVFINTATNFILPAFLQSIFTITVMAYFSIPIAFFTFILFPIYIYLSHLSTKKWGAEEIKKNEIEDITRGRIQEVISNMKLVKGYNTQQDEFNTVVNNLTSSNSIYARQSNMFHKVDFLRTMSLVIILTIVAIILFYDTYTGRISLGVMVLITQLLVQARRPLFGMSFILTRIQEAESGSKEFFELLQLPSTELFENKPASLVRIDKPQLSFEGIHFQYETSQEILKDIRFSIHSSEKVALVGHSGAGKTTIVNLIMKFYEPTSGTIKLNGKAYSKYSYSAIRNNIALVFQENELFSSTIRENVRYGTKASTKEIEDALKKAQAWDFVQQLPKGIDSEVGERGIRLSGGQKQRIQIARAILKDAPILILDEATSSLDAKSEREVQIALEHLMENKMVIIIAHRFSTIQNVNTIIVIDKGMISDCGSPQELAKKPGIYADLLHYQIEGNKKLLESFELY